MTTATDLSLRYFISDLVARYPVAEVILFGSHARGDAKPDSDWDVIVCLADSAAPETEEALLADETLQAHFGDRQFLDLFLLRADGTWGWPEWAGVEIGNELYRGWYPDLASIAADARLVYPRTARKDARKRARKRLERAVDAGPDAAWDVVNLDEQPTAERDFYAATKPLFAIGGRVYEARVNFSAGETLRYSQISRTQGVDAANEYAMTQALGVDAYQAFLEYPYMSHGTAGALMQRVIDQFVPRTHPKGERWVKPVSA